jgi:hypothetical protein
MAAQGSRAASFPGGDKRAADDACNSRSAHAGRSRNHNANDPRSADAGSPGKAVTHTKRCDPVAKVRQSGPMPAVGETEMDIHREGLFARALGRPRTVNPYPPESKEGWLSPDDPEDDTAPKESDGEAS